MAINQIMLTKQNVILVGILLLLILAGLINLDRIPIPWWDEGWTLNAARNWVTLGHYGQLIEGVPRDPGLSASFPVVAPVAMSIRFLGIGTWQGRLPSYLFFLGSLVLIYILANKLYNRPNAIGTIFVLIFLSGPVQLHPLTMGRTVLAEMPMLFYLLAGYCLLFLSLRSSILWIIAASIFWAIAIYTKTQALPFWSVSLILPLAATILQRSWRQSRILVAGLFLTLLFIIGIQNLVISIIPELLETDPIPGLFQVVTIVQDPEVRKIAISAVLTVGLPTLCGFVYAAWKSIRSFREQVKPDTVEILRISLLGFVGSWLAWFITLALNLDRYLFPAIFVGSIFTSAMLYDLTFQFNFKKTFQNASAVFFRSRKRHNFGAIFALLLLILLVPFSVQYLISLYSSPGTSVAEVTQYIEDISNADDLIETYESELYFMLDRRYHYPPDEIHVQIISREFIGNDVEYDYDPLAADPDYLVIGQFARISKIYDQVLEKGEFQIVDSIQGYEIFARNR